MNVEALTQRLDDIATEIEPHYYALALAIDEISDHLEKKAGWGMPSKEEALKIISKTFRNRPERLFNIIEKIIGLFGKNKKAFNVKDLFSLADPKILLAVLSLLVSFPNAQEFFNAVSDTIVDETVIPKTVIKMIKEDFDGAQPPDMIGRNPIANEFLKERGSIWKLNQKNVDGDHLIYKEKPYGVGVGINYKRKEALKDARDKAKIAGGLSKEIIFTDIKQSDSGVWVAIAVSGLEKRLENYLEGEQDFVKYFKSMPYWNLKDVVRSIKEKAEERKENL